jgi:tRNA(Ile)-lysidine synthase
VHLLALEQLLHRSGEIHLPGGIVARSEQGRLTLVHGVANPPASWDESTIALVGEVLVPGTDRMLISRVVPRDALGATPPSDARTVWLDADAVRPPLRIRRRRPGDRFAPWGAPGRRKVADVLVDRRVPRSERDHVPLLVDEAGILWLVGIRRGSRAAVGPETKRVLVIEVEQNAACEVNEGGQDVESSE